MLFYVLGYKPDEPFEIAIDSQTTTTSCKLSG